MPADFDALIIGGGPAGCAAAITCAAAGLRVRILERAAMPPDRPGETLHPGVEPLLDRLGVGEAVRSAGFIRHSGHWVQWDGQEQFVGFGQDDRGPWRGFQATRAVLDALMLARAETMGVEVARPCAAAQPILSQGRLRGIRLGTDEMTARFVVDATGSSRWLARHLGLKIERRSPGLVARYGYARAGDGDRFATPRIRTEDHGWLWTARVAVDLVAWTRLAVCSDNVEALRQTSTAVPMELEDACKVGRVRGCDVSWRRAEAPAGPGFFITGDAAAILDPASSHGVLRALMSGMHAGHSIARVLSCGASEEVAQSEYRDWIGRLFEHDAARLAELYRNAFPCPGAWFNLPGAALVRSTPVSARSI